jgi:hypothetical protein
MDGGARMESQRCPCRNQKNRNQSQMRKHPGIWFTLWAYTTIFLLSGWLSYIGLNRKLFYIVIFIWSSVCVFWITTFHTRWLKKWDEKHYKLQKLKDEWEKQKWVI